MGDDRDDSFRPVLVGLAALLGVALLTGALISMVALGAACVVGFGGYAEESASSAEASLYVPPVSPRSTPSPTATPNQPEASGTSEPAKPKKKKKARPAITLSVSPKTVSAMERINLTGRYPRGNGASLQVQRKEAGWEDFPTSATVRDGGFSTYVLTGRSGKNSFRVVDKSNGRASNPVTVTIR